MNAYRASFCPKTLIPKLLVVLLERFIVIIWFTVEADSSPKAERLCKAGKVAYERSQIEECDEVLLETVSIEVAD